MKITINLAEVADGASALMMRAAAAAGIDPLQQLRSLPADEAVVASAASAVKVELAAGLGCYFEAMGGGDTRWTLELWTPAWSRNTDSSAVARSLTSAASHAVASLLLLPTPLARQGAAFGDCCRRLLAELVALLDRATAVPVPPPGRVRRSLSPF